jgi:4,5-dihydroxyphthalate decarboxylase
VEGRTLLELLESGEIDAAISPGPVKLAGFGQLFEAASGAGQAWLAQSGTLPVMHLPAVRRSLAIDQPGAAEALVAGFAAGKTRYLAGLPEIARDGTDDPLERRDAALHAEYGVDPIPLGLDVFRTSFERLGRYMVEQGYLQSQPVIDALFVANPR